jgi:hypothetical protein
VKNDVSGGFASNGGQGNTIGGNSTGDVSLSVKETST